MPSGAFHSNYWAGSADPPVAPSASTPSGYIPWQINVISFGGFGAAQVVWEWAIAKASGTWPSRRRS